MAVALATGAACTPTSDEAIGSEDAPAGAAQGPVGDDAAPDDTETANSDTADAGAGDSDTADAGAGDGGDGQAPAAGQEDRTGEPVLVTPCLTVGPQLTLPPEWIAADVSSDGGDCLFVLQREQRADTTVIAGELFLSSAGRSFEEFVAQTEQDLSVGQEPDILALQLLNSGASGRDLPILERIELDTPNRAVILIHESDRRDGFTALSAVVHVPTAGDSGTTHAMKLWGLLLPISVGAPSQSPNYQLAIDLIQAMEIPAR